MPPTLIRPLPSCLTSSDRSLIAASQSQPIKRELNQPEELNLDINSRFRSSNRQLGSYRHSARKVPLSETSPTARCDQRTCRNPRFSGNSDGRCVGSSFRVCNDMADLSKNRVCCGHAAGHFVGSQGASRAIGPAGVAMDFSSTCPRLASSIGGLAYGGMDRLIFGTLSHEQIGRTRAYVITKWRQSEIQQVKETKVPPPRTHGKVGDPVGGQCTAVR